MSPLFIVLLVFGDLRNGGDEIVVSEGVPVGRKAEHPADSTPGEVV